MDKSKHLPKLSIVTPSFNQGKYLAETLESVLDQKYPNLEYIVMDGGSTDQSVAILKRYSKYLAYWESSPDRGQAHAVNKGLDRATGSIVGWINSDDCYVSGAFKAIVEEFKSHSDCVLVHGNRIMIDPESFVYGWGSRGAFDPQVTGYTICSETAFWRVDDRTRDLRLKESLRFAMDLEFFCRLYKIGQVRKLDAYLGYFRGHAESKSSTMQDVCKLETEREWQAIFGTDYRGWSNCNAALGTLATKVIHALRMVQHPKIIGAPYLYRRFILNRRGL